MCVVQAVQCDGASAALIEMVVLLEWKDGTEEKDRGFCLPKALNFSAVPLVFARLHSCKILTTLHLGICAGKGVSEVASS